MSFTDAIKYKISHKQLATYKANKVLFLKVIMCSESVEEQLKSPFNLIGKRRNLETLLKVMVVEQLALILSLSKKHY